MVYVLAKGSNCANFGNVRNLNLTHMCLSDVTKICSLWGRFGTFEDYSGKSTCVIRQNGNDQKHAQPIVLYYVSPAAYMEQTAHREQNLTEFDRICVRQLAQILKRFGRLAQTRIWRTGAPLPPLRA